MGKSIFTSLTSDVGRDQKSDKVQLGAIRAEMKGGASHGMRGKSLMTQGAESMKYVLPRLPSITGCGAAPRAGRCRPSQFRVEVEFSQSPMPGMRSKKDSRARWPSEEASLGRKEPIGAASQALPAPRGPKQRPQERAARLGKQR